MSYKIPAKIPEIEVEYINPSIASRKFDYCATIKGSSEEDGPAGYGETEQEAKDNLIEMIENYRESKHFK